jgi:chromate transporter
LEAPTTSDAVAALSSPHSLLLLRVWLGVGLQSFGGGSSTLALIERAAVHQQQWLTDEEFARLWALCQLAPGINLIALAILMGRRLAGSLGVVLSLTGMLLPSVAVTILITASYAHIRESAVAQAALRGILPATVGLGFLAAYRMALPLIKSARRQGMAALLLSVCLMAGSGAAVFLNVQVVVALLASALVGAAVGWRRNARQGADAEGAT